jgi:Domain of unknown function (DUF4136)
MKWQRLLCWLLVAAPVGGCASPEIGYDFDRSVNFSAYQSYAWIPGAQEATGDRRLDSSLIDARIRSAIDAQLRSKGYAATANGKPQFFVAYHIGMKDLLKGSSTQNYIGDRAHGTYTTLSDIQQYKEGTLLIDIVDAESKQLVWQASALAKVEEGLTPKERDERINGIVRAMLSHFPPK